MYQGLDNVGIAVADIDEAVAYYETLGFEAERYSEIDARVDVAEDGAYLYVYETDADGDTTGRDGDSRTNPVGIDHVSVGVEDVDEVHETLTDRGVEFVREPRTEEEWGLRMAAVQDPSGNLFYFVASV